MQTIAIPLPRLNAQGGDTPCVLILGWSCAPHSCFSELQLQLQA